VRRFVPFLQSIIEQTNNTEGISQKIGGIAYTALQLGQIYDSSTFTSSAYMRECAERWWSSSCERTQIMKKKKKKKNLFHLMYFPLYYVHEVSVVDIPKRIHHISSVLFRAFYQCFRVVPLFAAQNERTLRLFTTTTTTTHPGNRTILRDVAA
jgi:hypothetical protein